MAEQDERDELAQLLVANDGDVIARLRLSAAEAARVCRVTPRQLIYWTRKGIIQPSAASDADYDVYAMEKVIRIRQQLEKGQSLEKAAATVDRDLAERRSEIERIGRLGPDDLEHELRFRLDALERRIQRLRASLTAALGMSRLRRAVAALGRLERDGLLQSAAENGDSRAVVLRLGRAVSELEDVVKEMQPAAT